MPLGDEDPGVFFSDFGHSVVFAGNTASANFDSTAETDAFGDLTASIPKYRIELPFNAFHPFPRQNDDIQVDGVSYKVRHRR